MTTKKKKKKTKMKKKKKKKKNFACDSVHFTSCSKFKRLTAAVTKIANHSKVLIEECDHKDF